MSCRLAGAQEGGWVGWKGAQHTLAIPDLNPRVIQLLVTD